VTRSVTGVVRVGAGPLRTWLFRDGLNHPSLGPWPRLPLLIQGGEPKRRVSRQKLVRKKQKRRPAPGCFGNSLGS